MKKGFTLVELLAVIVILAIVLAIAIPGISNIIREATKSALMSDAKMVLKATDYKKMQDENFDATSVTEENINSLLQLSNANYTSLDIGYYNNELNIRIAGKDKWAGLMACGSFKTMVVTDGGECDVDFTAPRIILTEGSTVSVPQGGTYTEPGVTATDNVEGDLTSSIVTSGTVNTGVIGQYKITYTVSDSKGNQRTVVRTVNVVDSTPPVLTLIGSSTVKISLNSTYNDEGATATDNIDGDITDHIVKTSNVNPSIEGTYTVTYNVSDSSGNAATPLTRTVIVEAGVNEPVLASNMIPVMWDGSNWVKADSTNANATYKWYDYKNKIWANALTVTSTNRATYLSAAAGTVINPVDMLAFYVWIPRYAYQIASGYHTNTAGTINIKFLKGTTNVTVDDVTADTTATYSGSSQTNYIVHPAFTFGTNTVTGMWVGKFETAPDNTSSCFSSPTSTNCDKTTITPRIRPQFHPWVSISIANAFTVARNMEAASNIYGFAASEVDTHIMKNSEWGAAAYLAQSAYGKNSEVWINNAGNYITGYAGDNASDVWTGAEYNYTTANGKNASTTGNIYGIYDMSGGTWEFMTSYINNGYTNYGTTVTSADTKYREIYQYSASDNQPNNYALAVNKKGDAIYETSSNVNGAYGWYGDRAHMISGAYDWFARGGRYDMTTEAGIFSFYYTNGAADGLYTFRCVLMVGSGL